LLGGVSCWGGWGRPERSHGDGAWVANGDALVGLDLTALRAGGLKNLFVEAGTLEWNGVAPHVAIVPVPAALAGQARVTLVVHGAWTADLGDSKSAGAALAREIERLALDAQARGLQPEGVHLDLDADGNLTSYAQGLRAARGDVPKNLLLSASLSRTALGEEAAPKVARAVDYIVAFVYGQRPREADATAAWDFQEVKKTLARVEALKAPYLAGVISLGAARHESASGQVLETTTALDLGQVARNPRLKPSGGFTLEGLDRSVYAFEALEAAEVGPWQVRRGERVHVVGTGPSYLQALHKAIAEVATPRYRGELFYRLPGSDEHLTPSAEELVDALAQAPPTPELALSVEPIESNSQHWLFRVVLENKRAEASDLAMLDNNFVELSAAGGFLGNIDAGSFHRFDLMRHGSDAVDIAAIRAPERARLYLPVLAGRSRTTSGPIELRLRERNAQVTITASFLLPDGRTITAPSLVWSPTTK
jgi:hypothetical protein